MSDKNVCVFVWVWLTVGNFAYQAITGQHWDVASERTFFQGMAILIVVITHRLAQ